MPGWSNSGDARRSGGVWDPPGNFAFNVELDGVWIAQFASVDGLSLEREMIEYSFAGDDYTRKRPGGFKYGDITLKSGWIDTTLEDWLQATNPAKTKPVDLTRKTLAIVLTDNSGSEVRRWNCYECYPKAWKMSTFDAKGNDVMMEELVFSIEYWEGEAP